MKTSINLFAYFCLNYNHDFIEKCWGSVNYAEGENHIVKHFNSKFLEYHKSTGGYGAMLKFYVNLDLENQRKLENYITTNYKG